MSIYDNYTKPIKTENVNNINYIVILGALINMGTLGVSIASLYYAKKLSLMADYFNEISDNTFLNNETQVYDYINRFPHIIDTLCELIPC